MYDPEIMKRILDKFGAIAGHWSLVCQDHGIEGLIRFMTEPGIRNAVEIGTHHGSSAVVMAQMCGHLHTFDCIDFPERFELWKEAGLKNITSYVTPTDDEKEAILNGLDFDFAFLDGSHREGVREDFMMVKKCGRVLFHDYPDAGNVEYASIRRLVDGLPKSQVEIFHNFAMWRVS